MAATVTVDSAPEHGRVIVAVAGEIDLSTVPTVRAELVRALNTAGVDDREQPGPREPRLLVLDLTAVTFMASKGLSLLTELAELCRRRPTAATDTNPGAGTGPSWLLRIVPGDNPAVQRPVQLTGLATALPLFDTRAAALQLDGG
jgi:anti-anti-sigma factor